MKKFISIISLLLGASSAWATIITDDFNRADTGLNSSGATVGADWHSSRTTGGWGITDQKVVASMTEANTVLYNDTLETVSGGGTFFSLSLDVTASGVYWAGVVFNYQDADNFYWLRYKGTASNYSLVRFIGGSAKNVIATTITGTFATNTAYTLTVASSNAYEFTYEIKETVGGSVMVSGTETDSESAFTGGYAGILQSTTGPGRNTFDNFSLEVIPEPTTLGLMAVCAAGALFIRRLQL